MRAYENLERISENRLKQRAYYIPKGEANYIDLNGIWNFAFTKNGDEMQEPSTWNTIPVPSCWQFYGYEEPNYTNINYPFPVDPPYVPMENPIGIYERYFFTDKEKQLYLILEGVSSCAEIYINGKHVGYTQGSHLQAEFDITDYAQKGENTVRIAVRKWCSGSYLEDQDQFRHNGIFRDVYILERPYGHLVDFKIETDTKGITVFTDREVDAELFDKENLLVKTAVNGEKRIEISNPKLWNAENPYLYTLNLKCAGETISVKVGLRVIEVSDKKELLINGSPVLFKGVNHHDTSMENGWYMTDDEMLRDVKLMKELNVNAVRTSHYPPHPKFLEMCDEYGIYVILEADLEVHGFTCRYANNIVGFDVCDEYPTQNPNWKNSLLDRAERTYERDKNHCSVIILSSGNESGYGDNNAAMLDLYHNRDKTRLTHCEDASRAEKNEKTDVYSRMYVSNEELETLAKRDDLKIPIFLCEYSHAMGNGPGDIWEYCDTFRKYPNIIGGCVWEWADHAFVKNGVQCYGGDFNELTHDGNFCCDGIVFANRTLKAGAYEMKAAYTPFRINETENGFEITNYYDFKNFSDCEIKATVSCDGEIIGVKLYNCNAEPGETVELELPIKIKNECNLGCYLDVTVSDGIVSNSLQIPLQCKIKADEINCENYAKVTECENKIIFSGEKFIYIFSKYYGNFCSMIVNGKEKLSAPIKLTAFRAPIDNDRKIETLWWALQYNWQAENLDRQFTHIYSVDFDGREIKVSGSLAGVSRTPFILFDLIISVFENGDIKTRLRANVKENCVWLPRLGFEYSFIKEDLEFKYFGMGPLESYCDSMHHSRMDWHISKASQEYVNYVRPQEHGNHTGVKVLNIENEMIFTSKAGMDINVSQYSAEELFKAKHTNELIKEKGSIVHIDYKMAGLGSNSCGPELKNEYRVSEKNIEFDYMFCLSKQIKQ